MELRRSLPVIAEPDVLVCGAGCAGTMSAIAAARRGASTVLVEKCGFAGGYLTGVTGAALDGFVDLRSGAPVVGGIVLEFAREAAGFAADPTEFSFSPSNDLREMTETPHRKAIRFDLEAFKLYADRMFRIANVNVLFHTHVVDVLREGDRVIGVVVGNKAGLGVIKPKMVVDSTGDADVAAWAGAPFEIAPEFQPMSLHFRIANVSIDGNTKQQCSDACEIGRKRGELKLYGGPWMGRLAADSEVYINAARYRGNGIDPADLSAAEMQGREDANTMFRLFRQHVPAFKDAYLVSTGPVVGVRETRRITGDSTLTMDDVADSRPQKDVVALGAWYLDRHPQSASGYHVHAVVRPYDIGYGTMLPQGLGNVWVAGRCHSAESAALASSRVTVTAMALGQAAGTAAAMAAREGRDSRTLGIAKLQQQLLADGAIILDRAERVLAIGDAATDAPVSAAR